MTVPINCIWYSHKTVAIELPSKCSPHILIAALRKNDESFNHTDPQSSKFYLPGDEYLQSIDYREEFIIPKHFEKIREWKPLEPITLEPGSTVIIHTRPDPITRSIIQHGVAGTFTSHDMTLNGLDVAQGASHPTVIGLWNELKQSRAIPKQMRKTLKEEFSGKNDSFFLEFDNLILDREKDEVGNTAQDMCECRIYAKVSCEGGKRKILYERHREAFITEIFMGITEWLYEYGDRYNVQHSTQPWPLDYLLTQVPGQPPLPYTPTSDFSVWHDLFPYLLQDTYSNNPKKQDMTHIKLQAASIVKLFAACEVDFVLPVLYANANPIVTLSLLHEEGGIVKMYDQDYALDDDIQYLRFMVTLLNLLDREPILNERARATMDSMKRNKNTYAAAGSFTGGLKQREAKRPRTGNANQPQENGSSHSDKDAIEKAGYTFLNHNAQWPALYYAQDQQGVIRIIKKLKPQSNELKILKTLQKNSECENIISLVSTIDTKFVVLPLYTPLVPPLYIDGIPKHLLLPFSNDLCRGVIYLHSQGIAHLDIRPDNLVIDGERLLLIDFSESVQGLDQVEGFFGTVGYQAPEITMTGDKKFNPFKADVFSCGRTLQVLSNYLGDFDGYRSCLVERFTVEEPDLRSRLDEWFENGVVQ